MSEMYAAKQIFKSLKGMFPASKDLEAIGEVKLQIKSPPIGDQYWSPSEHDSLETYLASCMDADAARFDFAQRYDFDKSSVKVVNKESFKKYLKIPAGERGPLRIWIPPIGYLGRAFRGARAFSQTISDQVSDRMMKWCKNRFLKSEVTDEEVSKQLQKIQDAGVDIKAEELSGGGDIKEFQNLKEEGVDFIMKSLKDDGVPRKIISAIDRARHMTKNAEAVFDFKIQKYAMKIITLRKGSEFDILVAFYELS